MEIQRDRLYTVPETCALLQVSRRTLTDLLTRRELPAAKVGRSWRIKGNDILEYFERKKQEGR